MGISDQLTCLWETCMMVKKQKLEHCMEQLIDSRLRKEYNRAICCHPMFIPYTEHIRRNAELDELQAGIKIGERIIKILRYVDDTTLMAENKGELKSLLMRVKEEQERAGLRLLKKAMIMASVPITVWQIEGERWKQ